MKMSYIKWLDMDLIIKVEATEKSGRQTKFYGKCVKCKDVFWQNRKVETPFLYKSGWKTVLKP